MWFSMGPRNVSGRGRSLSIHPTQPNRVYAGSETGGIWRSEDGGASWTPLMFQEASLIIGDFAVFYHASNANQNTIYAGTGVHFEPTTFPTQPNMMTGEGLLVSGDDGASWTLRTGLTNRHITRVLVSPNHLARVYVGGKNGVERSHDGGNTWETILGGVISDMAWLPGNPNVLFVCVHQGALQKFTFHAGGSQISPLGNYDLSVIATPVSPLSWARLAIGVNGSHGNQFMILKTPEGTLYKTINQGSNWTTMTGNHGPSNTSSRIGSHTTIAVSPSNENHIIAGGQIMAVTDDGGTSWNDNVAGLHVDHHDTVFAPSNPNIVYDHNDGGVYRSDNHGLSWTKVSNGLVTTQFYHCGHWKRISTVMGGGLQDNGVQETLGGMTWRHAVGGDGGFYAIHHDDPRIRHCSSYSQIYRTTDGVSGSWTDISGTLDNQRPWLMTLFKDPTHPERIFTGTTRVYRTTGLVAAPWQAVSQDFGGTRFTQGIQAVAVAPSDGNRIYAGTGGFLLTGGTGTGKVFRTKNGGTTNWEEITGALPSSRPVSCLAVDPTNPDRVVAGFAGIHSGTGASHVFLTQNAGQVPAANVSWTDISFNLPNRNVHTVAIDPSNTQHIYAGTDVGLFRLDPGTSTWTAFMDGFPRVIVRHLTIERENSGRILMYAATYGRGIYKRNITPGYAAPEVDLYVRDSLLDTGEVQPSPSGLPNPYHATDTVHFWQSQDIKVDASPYQYTATFTPDGVEFDARLIHEDPIRTEINRFYLQIHNRGPNPAHGVIARAFMADASLGLPQLPHALQPGNRFQMNSNPNWTPLGATIDVGTVWPNHPAVVRWNYRIPASAATHSCVLAVVSCEQDPYNTSETQVGQLVRASKHVCLKNLHVIYRSGREGWLVVTEVIITNPFFGERIYDLVFQSEDFDGYRVGLMLEPVEFIDFDNALGGVKLEQLEPGRLDARWYVRPGRDLKPAEAWGEIDQTRFYRFEGQGSQLRGLVLRPEARVRAALLIDLREEFPATQSRFFSLYQRHEKAILGGSTYEIRNLDEKAPVEKVWHIQVVLQKIVPPQGRTFKGGAPAYFFRAETGFNDDRNKRHQVRFPERRPMSFAGKGARHGQKLNVVLFKGYVTARDRMSLILWARNAETPKTREVRLFHHKFMDLPETWLGRHEPAALRGRKAPWRFWLSIQRVRE